MTFCFPSTLVLRSRRIYYQLDVVQYFGSITYVLEVRLLSSVNMLALLSRLELVEDEILDTAHETEFVVGAVNECFN
jgi:hypothetical protein